MKSRMLLSVAAAMLAMPLSHAQTDAANPLVGTWELTATEKLLPNGSRVTDYYGTSPHGLVIFTADGHYSVSIFGDVRPKFAGNDREKGTLEDYRTAQLNSSCSFGTYTVDAKTNKLSLYVDRSTYPNNDNATVVRSYELNGDTLSWKVSPRPDGSVPITVVQRIAK